MSIKKIFINQEEEIISIVDKILHTSGKEVTLFLPRGAQIFQSNINLKLLKREADNAEKQVTIVTEDEGGQKMALKNSFVVFNSKEEFDYYQDQGNDKDELTDKEQIPEPEPKQETVASSVQPSVKEEKTEETGKDDQPEVKRPAPVGAGRVIDLRSGSSAQPAMSDIKINKKDDNYFEKLIEEKSHFDDSLPGDEDFSLSIDVDEKEESGPKKEEGNRLEATQEDKGSVKKTSFFGVLESIKSKKPTGTPPGEPKIKQYLPSQENSEDLPSPVSPSRQKTNWLPKVSVTFAILGLLMVLGVVYFALPKVEIFLTLNRQNVTGTVLAVADKNIREVDIDKGNIPAKVLEVSKQQRQTFQATGQKQVNKKATGTITVFNEFSSAPQGLVETTRFLTSDGKIFRTTESIVVPGATIENGQIIASSIDVEVVADEPGEDYNIEPTEFSIPGFEGSPKYEGFYGRSTESMQGGKIGTVNFVSEEDMQKAITQFSNEDIFDLVEEVKKQVPEGYILLDDCIEQQKIEDKTEVAVGDVADVFEIHFDFSIRAIAFSGTDLMSLAASELLKKNDQNLSKLETDSILIEYKDVNPNFEDGTVKILANVSGNFINKLDLERIKQDLVDKKGDEVRDYFSRLSDVADGEVKFWPFFVRSIPQNAERIEIFVD